MKREKILLRLRQAAEERRIVAVQLKSRSWNESVWPLRVSETMALCANDCDFQLNGWDVIAIDAIQRVDFRYDKYAEFATAEGLRDALQDPGYPLEDWQSFFAALPADQLVGVERCQPPEGEAAYAVGRVVKAGKKRVRLLAVDGEAVWQEEPWRIRYADINAVRAGDRYLTGFGKHTREPVAQEETKDEA
ncbi:MAG: hypothetical protein IKK57_08365 [Clostridia bacterium]|nr:hypothetical protein [Clostridia bacterium]